MSALPWPVEVETSRCPELAASELTPAERRVAALMAEGLENAEIAAALSVSRCTVKKQVSQVLSKLRARNRTHAVVLLLQPDAGAER